MAPQLLAVAVLALAAVQSASAKECWMLSDLKGQVAASAEQYVFQPDKFSNPMLLCFEEKTGTVSGDDTRLTRFGTSTLAGWGTNKGIELFEVYQIDRVNGRVLFTKSRIGTNTLIPGGTDVVGAFVGKAIKLSE
jgi:hypothetical protein